MLGRILVLLACAPLIGAFIVLIWMTVIPENRFVKWERQSRWQAADLQCERDMRMLRPAVDAEADFARGNRLPILLQMGDVAPWSEAAGLGRCNPPGLGRGLPRVPEICSHGVMRLSGPAPSIGRYAALYNRRLFELAPREVAAACGLDVEEVRRNLRYDAPGFE